ncbi:hypothetical protein E2562_016343 [Oryza meyeriana var. granulata]|uniref:DUF7722 domain-containing protein n=1 Tax=Oryza meyeriana var. granulata TaxID=110450 RepID=A0A6G1DY64_9ORYZ|nr:hypothetical protein E2562_016343 [Oryza meyeriana var. granulata]
MPIVSASPIDRAAPSVPSKTKVHAASRMPLHYPRYRREDYESMPEWQLDRLLSEYGLPVDGNLHQKRAFAIGAFLWGANAGHAA